MRNIITDATQIVKSFALFLSKVRPFLLLNQVADHTLATIGALRVDAVEVPHHARQVTIAGVQHKAVVLAHQAVRQHLSVEAAKRLPEYVQIQAWRCYFLYGSFVPRLPVYGLVFPLLV